MKHICVLGLGYIGLPTAAMFATHGLCVTGVDISPETVERLRSGEIHIKEPGLQTLVRAALLSGNMTVRQEPVPADAFIIAVPTPLNAHGEENGSAIVPNADLTYICAAAESIATVLQPGNLVVLESTSPPGTTVDTIRPILERTGLKGGTDFHLAYCPERVLPGRILDELVRNERIVGGINEASTEMARELYAHFVEGNVTLTDVSTAEMVKLMENTYRDVNIALANELSLVAEKLGIDIWRAIEMANRHPRVHIHRPGPGVGGHCIAVDPWFIAASHPEATPLIQTARQINDARPSHVVAQVKNATADIENPVIACLGLAYKANVDDIRESPALAVLQLLEKAGFRVRSYDPHVPLGTAPSQVSSLKEAITDADCLVLLTDHNEFQHLKSMQASPDQTIIDTRGHLTV